MSPTQAALVVSEAFGPAAEPTSHILTALPFGQEVARGERIIVEVLGVLSLPYNVEFGKKLFYDLAPELLESGHLKVSILGGGPLISMLISSVVTSHQSATRWLEWRS